MGNVVILNGKRCDSSDIDPTKHTFIGTFRPPDPPTPTKEAPWTVYLCACGQQLWYRECVRSHWMRGHMDLNQYVTIDT
jgi:hypothetical protein